MYIYYNNNYTKLSIITPLKYWSGLADVYAQMTVHPHTTVALLSGVVKNIRVLALHQALASTVGVPDVGAH